MSMKVLYGMQIDTLWCEIVWSWVTMSKEIVIEDEDSDNSVVEVEVPKRKSPPVIDIVDDELLLNIEQRNPQCLLAKDVINMKHLVESTSGACQNSSKTLEGNSPSHWTSDMIKFYNDDWGGEEHFVVEKIQETMDKTPTLWKISRKDILFMNNKRKRSNTRCKNCLQFGHPSIQCPDPPYVPKCHMCGTPGHLENHCPNSKCLNCGSPSKEYITGCFKCRSQTNQKCSRCLLVGHNFINCTDHWRLFHLTTDSTSVKVPNKNIYKPIEKMWCCNCGKQGHLQTYCSYKKDCYPDTSFFIVSYTTAFNNNTHKSKNNEKFWRDSKPKKETIMMINPLNKNVKKNHKFFKNKYKVFKKRKRNKKNKGYNNNNNLLLH